MNCPRDNKKGPEREPGGTPSCTFEAEEMKTGVHLGAAAHGRVNKRRTSYLLGLNTVCFP